MNGDIGLIIVYIVFSFFGLVILSAGITMFVLWRRRKLTFTNFLSDTGMWEKCSWKPDEIKKTFSYDGTKYKFDIKKCTRDRINRPIAHYYKGNPEQQIFDYSKGNTNVNIGTKTITGEDFHVLMLSKVLRDIFQDEEVMNWLKMILLVNVCLGILICVLVMTHNPAVILKDDNTTKTIIAEGVKMAINQV